MNIENMISKPNLKSITVTLTYEETRDIANGLYWLNRIINNPGDKSITKEIKSDSYKEISAKTSFLFDMIKHGMVQPETIAKFSNMNDDIDKSDNDSLSKYHGQV